MVYAFHSAIDNIYLRTWRYILSANSHLEMQLNDIIIVLPWYQMPTQQLIPPKMADTNISIWYRCIPTVTRGLPSCAPYNTGNLLNK